MADETKTIELWACGYQARCNVRNCKAKATALARVIDAGRRAMRQYEVCTAHAEQVSERNVTEVGRSSRARNGEPLRS
jgi:hypothetical protein